MNQTTFALTLIRDTPDLAESMERQIPHIGIIDNGSINPIPRAWLRIHRNCYFSKGWNKAVNALFRIHKAEWAWLLNSDVSGCSMEMFKELLNVAKRAGAVMASPAIIGCTHKFMQPGCEIRDVGWIDCVAPLVNVDWFLGQGGFDEWLLGYGADIDLCYRSYGTKIVVSNLVIEHQWCATSNRLGDFSMYEMGPVREYLECKHGPAIRDFAPSFWFDKILDTSKL